MQIRSGSNWYNIAFDASTSKATVTAVHPTSANVNDVKVKWEPAQGSSNGKLIIETKDALNIPMNKHGQNGAQGGTDNASGANALLGHVSANQETLSDIVSDNVDIRELDGESFKIRYLGQEITVTKSGGDKPVFTTAPAKTGVKVVWDGERQQVKIESEQIICT